MLGQLDKLLSTALSNPYAAGALQLFLVLYAGMAAPSLPPMIARLFDNSLFKIAVLAMVLVVNKYNTTVALLTAVGFMLSLSTLSKYRVFQLASDVSNGQYSGNPLMVQPTDLSWAGRQEERDKSGLRPSWNGPGHASFGRPHSQH